MSYIFTLDNIQHQIPDNLYNRLSQKIDPTDNSSEQRFTLFFSSIDAIVTELTGYSATDFDHESNAYVKTQLLTPYSWILEQVCSHLITKKSEQAEKRIESNYKLAISSLNKIQKPADESLTGVVGKVGFINGLEGL
jgi:hypothetical protein